MPLKKILLTLIAFGLLWSFQNSIVSDYTLESSEIVDASSDKDTSKEDSELENSKLFGTSAINFKILRITLAIDSQVFATPKENFTQVPTSPPNC